MDIKKQIEIIKRGTVEIIDEKSLITKLEESAKKRAPLIIKAGFDPSAPDIHLGHTVLLRKLKHFQELGHRIVFLIGDFTAMIGDPSGRSAIRNRLTEKEVNENAKTYKKQAAKILDIKRCEVAFNSKWLKNITLADFLDIASRQTIARILERDDFSKRYNEGKDISMLEFIYPLLQAYDSVILKADVELGGTDQKFNLLMGRALQRRYEQPEQIVITMPLLEGTDGARKMSKSYGNYIGIDEPAKDMFGKIMSVSDELMWKYYELLTDTPMDEISQMRDNAHPMDAKRRLAKEIITLYHNSKDALLSEREFDNVFSRRNLPNDIQTYKGSHLEKKLWICKLLSVTGLAVSNSEARRLVKSGAVTIDGEKMLDENVQIEIKDGMIIQVGKRRFLKIEY